MSDWYLGNLSICHYLVGGRKLWYIIVMLTNHIFMLLQVVRTVLHISWSQDDPNYSPVNYTAPSILAGPPYADKLPR